MYRNSHRDLRNHLRTSSLLLDLNHELSAGSKNDAIRSVLRASGASVPTALNGAKRNHLRVLSSTQYRNIPIQNMRFNLLDPPRGLGNWIQKNLI